jgi:transposase
VVRQQQFLYQYIYGAVCPAQKQCAALVLPVANHKGLALHLQEISEQIPPGRHAVVIMDQAGWHHKKEAVLPANISILHLPPYAPELNPQEQVWQHLKDNYLANRVFKDQADITDACCRAWNAFAKIPDFIRSLTTREWAVL